MPSSEWSADQPLNRMGIDSLMAVELKHEVEANFGANVSLVDLLEGTSIRELASQVVATVGIMADAPDALRYRSGTHRQRNIAKLWTASLVVLAKIRPRQYGL